MVLALRSAHLMRLAGKLGSALAVGEVPNGIRRILHFTGGTFAGPDLSGEILPGGGDWVLLRRDGVAELDIRMTLRTGDGALIHLSSSGLLEISSGDRALIERGEDIDPSRYYFRTSQRFETGADRYRWLNRRIAVGVGQRTPEGMVTEVFSVL